MAESTAIINASPLIFLSRAGRLDLLRHFGRRFLVPDVVANELLVRGPADPTVVALSQNRWLTVIPAPPPSPEIASWGLGAGESSVLSLALAEPDSVAIMDDLAGRPCAESLHIPVRGTMGIVLTARKRGLLPAARPVLEELVRSGMYLSRATLDSALARVGE